MNTVKSFNVRPLQLVAAALAVLGSSVASAQTPAQVAAALSTSVAPVQVGGLILSPVQRQNLEFVRRSGGADERQRSGDDVLLGGGAPVSDTLIISGVVIRSGNRSTVWVNNQPLYGQAAPSALRSLARQGGVVGERSGNMSIKSKAGQIIDVPTRQAVDLLPPGAIVINRPKAGTGNATVKDQK